MNKFEPENNDGVSDRESRQCSHGERDKDENDDCRDNDRDDGTKSSNEETERGENDDDGRDDGRAQRSEQKNGENEENGGCEIRDERDYCSGYFLDDATQNRCRNNRTRHQCWTRTSLIKVKTNVETANNQSRVS